jgi:hypothetical protein
MAMFGTSSRHLTVKACIEDAAVIEKILTHFQGKDTSVSTSLRHYNPPRAEFLLAAIAQ